MERFGAAGWQGGVKSLYRQWVRVGASAKRWGKALGLGQKLVGAMTDRLDPNDGQAITLLHNKGL